MRFKLGAFMVLAATLCSGLLLGAGVLASAQEPTSQQASPAADNTKVNEQDRSQNEPIAVAGDGKATSELNIKPQH